MVTHITESQCSLQSVFGVCHPMDFEEETTYLSKNYYFQFLITLVSAFLTRKTLPLHMNEARSNLNTFLPKRKERMLLLGISFFLSLSIGDKGILPPIHPIRQELFLRIKLIQ